MRRAFIAVTSVAVGFGGFATAAESADQFYAGKTVRILIGTPVGGEYGLYSQLVARHIGRHVPGRPTVIVQSMPGAGGITALRYAANIAPHDGTVLIVPQVSIVQEGLLNPKAQFDPAKFQWIGRMASQVQAGVVSTKSNVRSLDDAKKRQLIAGGTGVNPTVLNPRILNVLAGTKFKIVTGYKGTAAVMIAWERGEVDVLTTSWDMITNRYRDRVMKVVVPLYLNAVKRPPELAKVPLMTDFGKTDTDKAFLQIYSIGAEIGRSLAAPPGVPAERVSLWREAFAKMLGDPQFKAAVSKGHIRIDPVDGKSLAASVSRVVTLPTKTVIEARKFYEKLVAGLR